MYRISAQTPCASGIGTLMAAAQARISGKRNVHIFFVGGRGIVDEEIIIIYPFDVGHRTRVYEATAKLEATERLLGKYPLRSWEKLNALLYVPTIDDLRELIAGRPIWVRHPPAPRSSQTA